MTDTEPQTETAQRLDARRRSASRLAAVQALYQLEMNKMDPESIILEFVRYRPGAVLETENEKDDAYLEVDPDLFSDIVRGAARREQTIDGHLGDALPKDWPIGRLERPLRATLRAGLYELMLRPDIPKAVIINEYVDIAHGFFDGSEPAMVNAVLDKAAGAVRD